MAVSAPSPPEGKLTSSLSKFLTRLRSKRERKDPSPATNNAPNAQQQVTVQLPPLVSSPLPLVLPQHQQALQNLGWTTLTFPSSTPELEHGSLPPSSHPLYAASRALFQAAQTFFDLPSSEKERWKHRLGTEEGWTSIPGEKEFITLRTLAYTPDVLRDAAATYWGLMGSHLESTLGRIESSLEMRSSALTRFVGPCKVMGNTEEDKTSSMVRIFRYEVDGSTSQEKSGKEDAPLKVVAEPHADLGLLSVVVGDVPGLEVWDGQRFFDIERDYIRESAEDAHASGMGKATMLAGRQLERLSNFRYRAGGHRVVGYPPPPPSTSSAATAPQQDYANSRKLYRHSIVFVLRAHSPVTISSADLETRVTGQWNEEVKDVTAGQLYDAICGKHYNVNIGMEEREKQRRKVAEAKGRGSG